MDVLGPVMKKRLFGGYTVSAFAVVLGSVRAFWKGAVLAYARADQYERLCSLISEPGAGASVEEYTRDEARKSWDAHGANARSLTDYILRSEFPTVDLGDPALLRSMCSRRMVLGGTVNRLGISTANGMGFGATFPDSFRAMWEDDLEHPESSEWARAVEAGLNIPSIPETLPFREAVQLVLRETAEYARDYFPHLVAELKLDAGE